MGAYLPEPDRQKHYKEETGNKLAYGSAQMQGWRKTMEDAAIYNLDIGDGNALFGVFDGHGGFQVSKYVIEIFERQLKACDKYKEQKYIQALEETFKHVDWILQSPEGQKGLNRMRSGNQNSDGSYIGGMVGCTANVVLITKQRYFVANAGDSRSVLCRSGTAVAMSVDHKPESKGQQARIQKAGGKISQGRVNGGLNLTRSLGDFNYKRQKQLAVEEQAITCMPEVKEFARKQQDQFILIGCDGIWQTHVQDNQAIIDIVRSDLKKKGIKQTLEDLLDHLTATDPSSGLGCDNMTAILIVFKN